MKGERVFNPVPLATPPKIGVNLLLFPASLRHGSHQGRLINYAAQHLPTSCTPDILRPDEVALPIFNQDLEREPEILKKVIALHQRFMAADGVIVASPEYNGHVSAYMKNTVDWISRLPRIDPRFASVNPFRDKPLLLTSASTGWTGGVLGLRDARSLFAYVGYLVAADQICVSDADHWISGDGYAFNPDFGDFVARTIANFVALSLRHKAGRLAWLGNGDSHG